jgi:prepilin-type N-terminal cleavage/methylation domain-containing protein
MQFFRHNTRPGFTLVELLLAMAIMAGLASITITALNPTRQMADARNTQRKFDVNTILNAFGQFSIDSQGFFLPDTIDGATLLDECSVKSTPKKLCKPTIVHGTSPGQCGHIDVGCVWSRHLSGAYIADIPHDPRDNESSVAEQAMVDYLVRSESPGRFRVDAVNAENGMIIGALR